MIMSGQKKCSSQKYLGLKDKNNVKELQMDYMEFKNQMLAEIEERLTEKEYAPVMNQLVM